MRIKLFLSFVLFSCQEHSQQDLSEIFNPSFECKNGITSIAKIEGNQLWSSTTILYSDSTYLQEWGSEGRSNISVGIWQLSGDSVKLIALEQDDLKPVCDLQFDSRVINSENITFRVLDKEGNPFDGFTIVAYDKRMKNGITDKNAGQYVSNNYGQIVIPRTEHDSLFFYSLYNFSNREYRLSTVDVADTVVMRLSFDNKATQYTSSDYWYSSEPRKIMIDSSYRHSN
jgi:hypothetical protein